MALTDRKITIYEKNIKDLSDRPNEDGLTSDELKAFFDGRGDKEIKDSINGIVNDLTSKVDGASGADQIGSTPLKVGGAETVQGVLEELADVIVDVDDTTVKNTGNETVDGEKSFIQTTDFQNGITFGNPKDEIKVMDNSSIGAWGVQVGTENGNRQGGLFIGAGGNDNGGTESKKLLRIWDGESWKQVWHEDNDGHASGLDADTLDGKHNSDMVHIAGTETITGTKTFSTAPVVPAPTSDTHAATKKYADDIASARYTKTNMQTSGQALLHWDNLTNVPNLADNHWKTPVANQAALPVTGNALGDNRVVLDDGDGKQAVYTCVATTGTYTQQWSKVGDVDWMTEEQTRITQETARVNAEGTESPKSGRVGAEIDRVAAENARILAEGTADPRTGRAGAELDRRDAFDQMEEDFVGMHDFIYGQVFPRSARLVVGTSASGWTVRDCDYLCDGTADQTEINAAITALPATGGEVVILDGTYNITSKIDVTKDNVSIVGNGNATRLKRMFNSSTAEGVITLTGRIGCSIANLQVDGNKASYANNNNCGIRLYDSINNTVTGNTCNNNDYGISLSSSIDNTVTGNTCNNNDYGIRLYDSSDNTVTGNTCNNNSSGIYLDFSSDNTVTGNTCGNNNYSGIYLNSSSNNTLTGNTCNNNDYGIRLYDSSDNTVTGNTCGNNNYYGIILNSSSNNTLTGNTCNNNSSGIYLDFSSDNTVTGNTCGNNNYYGIYLSSSNNNTLTGNTCIRGTGLTTDYTASQYTIRLAETNNNYNLISNNNCMGRAPMVDGGTGNCVYGNKYDSGDYKDFTQDEKTKLAGIEAGAEVNPDIADDLETDDATKVLSAKQGKVIGDLVSTNVGDLETLTTTDKSSLVNATNEVKNLVDTNTQFTDVDNVVYSWRFIKSAEGHMQLEYTEVI